MSVAISRRGGPRVRPLRDQVKRGDSARAGWLRILRIDLKRGGGIWLLPIAALFAFLILRNSLTSGVALWPEITGVIAGLAQPLMIFTVAISALFAGRESRQQVGELTFGTAMSAWQRYLSLAASMFLWALGLYAAFGGPLLVYGAAFATWGAPEWGVIVAQIPILALAAAFGVLVGRLFHDRTAAAIAIALFLLLFAIPFVASDSTRPLNVLVLNGWFEAIVENAPERPISLAAQLAWGAGLAGVVVCLGIVLERRTALRSLMTVACIALAVAGGAGILDSGYRQPTVVMSPASRMDMESPAGSICDDSGAVTVCVHPAYERLLPDVAEDVNAYLEPTAGLNGSYNEIYISSGNGRSAGWEQEDGRAFSSIDLSMENDVTALIARDLWPMSFMMAPTDQGSMADTAQYVVMTALAREIGVDEWPEWFYRIPADADDPDVQSAIDRFAALTPDEQRSWLESHWNDLSQGKLTLEDLP